HHFGPGWRGNRSSSSNRHNLGCHFCHSVLPEPHRRNGGQQRDRRHLHRDLRRSVHRHYRLGRRTHHVGNRVLDGRQQLQRDRKQHLRPCWLVSPRRHHLQQRH